MQKRHERLRRRERFRYNSPQAGESLNRLTRLYLLRRGSARRAREFADVAATKRTAVGCRVFQRSIETPCSPCTRSSVQERHEI